MSRLSSISRSRYLQGKCKTITILGTHGVGKTTLARELESRMPNTKFVEIDKYEHIYRIKNLYIRQLYSLSYVYEKTITSIIEDCNNYMFLIFDNHPLLNLAYIKYYCNNKFYNLIKEIMTRYMIKMDIGIFLTASPYVVQNRIEKRNRKIRNIESNLKYIILIDNYINELIKENKRLFKKLLVIDNTEMTPQQETGYIIKMLI